MFNPIVGRKTETKQKLIININNRFSFFKAIWYQTSQCTLFDRYFLQTTKLALHSILQLARRMKKFIIIAIRKNENIARQ